MFAFSDGRTLTPSRCIVIHGEGLRQLADVFAARLNDVAVFLSRQINATSGRHQEVAGVFGVFGPSHEDACTVRA